MHVIERLPNKTLKIKALVMAGLSYEEMAIRLDVTKSTVKNTLKQIFKEREDFNLFRCLLEIIADLSSKSYKAGMNEVGEIAEILSSWDSNAVSRLAEDLRSGKLAQHYAVAAEPAKTTDRSSPPDGQFYANRPNRRESAPQFIERVYGGAGWLTGSFTRADLRKIDPEADIGLRNWEKNHKQRAPIDLPTKQEANDRLLASGAPIETNDPRETARRRSAAWRRQQPSR